MISLEGKEEKNNDTERQYHDTSTTTNNHFDYGGLEVEGEREYFNGESLSLGVTRIFGFDIHAKITDEEAKIIGSNKRLLKLIEGQRIFHVLGLMKEFAIPQSKIYALKNVLVRRHIIKAVRWKGKSKSTLGMILYLTKDCLEEDVHDYLIDYNEMDLLRLDKQKQREKPSKSPEDIVDHNIRVQELSEQHKLDSIPSPDSTIDWCDDPVTDMHKHLKFCKRSHRS